MEFSGTGTGWTGVRSSAPGEHSTSADVSVSTAESPKRRKSICSTHFTTPRHGPERKRSIAAAPRKTIRSPTISSRRGTAGSPSPLIGNRTPSKSGTSRTSGSGTRCQRNMSPHSPRRFPASFPPPAAGQQSAAAYSPRPVREPISTGPTSTTAFWRTPTSSVFTPTAMWRNWSRSLRICGKPSN